MQNNIETAQRAESNKSVQVEPAERRRLAPTMDVYENADEFVLLLDVPGVDRDHITLDLGKGVLTLSATRLLPGVELEYHRTVTVSDAVDPSTTRAELDRGVLTVHLGKRAELKPRRIEIQ